VLDGTGKNDRKRFVNFAFAAAQLLIETDRDGVVRWAAGASFGLRGAGVESLVEVNLFSLVAPADRTYLANLLDRIRGQGVTGLMRVSLVSETGKSVSLLMGGRTFETDPEILYLAFLMPPDNAVVSVAGSLQGAEALAKAATSRMAVSNGAHTDEGVALLVVEGLAALAAQPGGAALVQDVSAKIAAFLRAISVGGDHISPLALGKWGIVRGQGINESVVEQGINAILASAKIPAQVASFEIAFEQGSLSDADAARALTYAINKFAEDPPESYDIHSLLDASKAFVADTVKMVSEARRLMETNQIEIVYQPIVRIDRNTIHHVEALSRISGISSIQDWIRFIEESGLSYDYDLALCERVLSVLEGEAKAGWRPLVAVNLSGRSLSGDIFFKRLKSVLERHANVARQFMIEVTETAFIKDAARMAKVLEELRGLGHTISLDDVGAGKTSLEALRMLPADFFKIDGSVVRGAVRGDHDASTLAAIVAIARAKGAELIAEQIESLPEARAMASAGARFGQGWLYGKPTADLAFSSHRHVQLPDDPGWVPLKTR
jgi:EAL domain-containing protein (putative c-di-GMP-specific phosphodiesterase class I)